MEAYLENYRKWLASPSLSEAEREELRGIGDNGGEIKDRFVGPLEFGTAGLRGIMGIGLNRMNVHVVRHATQAFAEVILAESGGSGAVALCCDCRIGSMEFMLTAASVLTANGIPVNMFDAPRPTPELSFAIRERGCIAGINITASHNPKEYNGYKVYWADGAQLPPRHAAAVAKRMAEIDVFDSVKTMDINNAAGLVAKLGAETDEAFLSHVMAQANDQEAVSRVADKFKVVYTPFHGTGYKLVPEALRRLGVKHVLCVPEQMEQDGSFPTVDSPNPENPEGFKLAVRLADKRSAQLIIGTDPDADRVGILAKDGDRYALISGNQTGALLLDYLIAAKRRAGSMPPRPVALKTIVTTELARRVAEENGVRCIDTFTGFKFMAERKNELEARGEGTVIFSYEESFGYMLGDFVRDKDAVTASLLLAEMAAWYYGLGTSLCDALRELYKRYGFYNEKTLNLMMPGVTGMEDRARVMEGLRANPPVEISGVRVLSYTDYQSGERVELGDGRRARAPLSGSNVLRYELEDGTVILARPSGTEPKIKVYVLAKGESEADCAKKLEEYSRWAYALR